MQTIPFTDLRARLAETLRALEQGAEPLFISRRGEPAAVLMSVAQYRQLQGQADGPAARLAAWRARHQPDMPDRPVSAESDTDPWADVRDHRPARPVLWADAADDAGTSD